MKELDFIPIVDGRLYEIQPAERHRVSIDPPYHPEGEGI